jgi:hypothetical protein
MAPGAEGSAVLSGERGAALALLPLASTIAYYALPAGVRAHILVQFAPQLIAYAALGLWAYRNGDSSARLGLAPGGIQSGLQWGVLTGLLLGCANSFVILVLTPKLGYDVTFLKATPHARIPFAVMVPWFIAAIAIVVELNFRGFLLGRLVILEAGVWKSETVRRLSPLALLASSLTFACDPFMVQTFRHLHWIAVWDGLVWGIIRVRTRNLFITVVAHATEVIIMYCAVRAVLLP